MCYEAGIENVIHGIQEPVVVRPKDVIERPPETFHHDFPSNAKCFAHLGEDVAISVAMRTLGHAALDERWTPLRDDMFSLVDDNLMGLWVRHCEKGWVIDRCPYLDYENTKVLCYLLGDMPVLFENADAAMVFAQACHPRPQPEIVPIGWLG